MHPLRWEHLRQLAENILQQSVVALLRCTHHIAGIVAIRGFQPWGIVTQHIGTHTSQIVTMTRQINFGDNLNISYSGILHHLTHLLLREVTAITLSPLAITSRHGRVTTTKGSHLAKIGMRFYLYAPALIIREMNMKFVNLMMGKILNKRLHLINLHPRTAHIKHKTSVAEFRSILHLTIPHRHRQWQLPSIYRRRQELQQRFNAIMHTRRRASFDYNALLINNQGICLGS